MSVRVVSSVPRPLWLVIVLGVAALSGCVGDDGPVTSSDPGGVEHAPEDVVVTDRFGSIQGSVTSDLFEPLAGAKVTLIESGRETKVARNGFFTMNEVEPGTYQLLAAADGYADITRGVTVTAGDVSEVTIQLVPIAVDRSWSELIQQTGLILEGERYQIEVNGQCQVVHDLPVWGDASTCGGTTSSVMSDIHPMISDDVMTQLIEVQWEPAGPLGEYLTFGYFCPDVESGAGIAESAHPCFEWAPGQTSPLIIRHDKDTWDFTRGNWTGEWTGSVDPGYGMLGTHGATGVDIGITYQQSFTFYQSFFHLAKAPEGYSALPDA